MNDPLDAEIAAALDQFGFRARAWQRISTIRAAETGRSVFRIDLEAGGMLKARRFEDTATARALFELRQAVPPGFAPALHCRDAVLLEAWIDGEALGRPTPARLAEAGALLARLHATPSSRGHPLPAPRSTRGEREAAEHALASLAAEHRLSRAETDRIGAALARLDPKSALAGVVHTDFCGENMIVDREGRLTVIDNERMGVGALGLDVARTWYRWMLPPAGWECFRASYAATMAHDDALRHFTFWAVVATLKSAALFSRLDPARAYAPVESLRKAIALEQETVHDGHREGPCG